MLSVILLLVLASGLLCPSVHGAPNPATDIIAPTAKESLSSPLDRALELIGQIMNLVAAVDIYSVDRRASPISPTLAKEGWRFARNGQTNVFTRTRYLPFSGREIIESTNYCGGRLLAEKSVSLPNTVSLPGFEVYNLLAGMRAANSLAETHEGGSILFSAALSPTETQKVWFAPQDIMPFRIEKHRGNDLVMVYTRTPDTSGGQVQLLRDIIHFYKHG